jgi:asparagine synthase (glutamine-hydrolysing)
MNLDIKNGALATRSGFHRLGKLELFFKGYLLLENDILIDAECLKIIERDYLSGDFKNRIKTYNGSFQLVVCDEAAREVVVVQDRYGTLPLYYRQGREEMMLSTDWRHVVDPKACSIRKDAVIEAVAFGHVLGDKTLVDKVYEFSPHSITTIDFKGALLVQNESYWKYQLSYQQRDSRVREKEFADLWRHKIGIFARHLKEQNERVLIPVTGGLDSRAIASEMDRQGVEMVPMTYGHQLHNHEIKSALSLVDNLSNNLGHFIQYNNDAIMRLALKEAPACSRITSLHFAEKDLLFARMIHPFCRYTMSGHSGDTITGGHLGYRMKTWRAPQEVITHILKYKSLGTLNSLSKSKENMEYLMQSLSEMIKQEDDPVNSFMVWNMEQRQRRYTLRSIIPDKEALQLNLLPFFDNDVVDFYSSLEFKQLVSKKTYINSQIRYLYSHNKSFSKIPNNGKRLKPIGSSFIREFSEKTKKVLGEALSIKQKEIGYIYKNNFDWSTYIDQDLIPYNNVLSQLSDVHFYYQSVYALVQLQKEINHMVSSQ